jgi:hypothetical protein
MLELLSITADPAYARRLWAHPGNTVFVDLEIQGKRERQSARDTVISVHTMEDAGRLARLPDRGPLLVRTNPAGAGAEEEAPALARLGVDRVMLPMFRTREEVDAAVGALGAAGFPPPRLTLLAETADAVRDLEIIVGGQPPWVDHVHIGLNDLSLERGTPFLFEPVATGEVAELARRVRSLGRRFGFGGVGMPGRGLVPAEMILGEHVRVGSSCVILSRSFHGAVRAEDPEPRGPEDSGPPRREDSGPPGREESSRGRTPPVPSPGASPWFGAGRLTGRRPARRPWKGTTTPWPGPSAGS